MGKQETPIQSSIIEYLEAQGAVDLNPKTTSYSRKGTPDISACFRGIFIAIEVKAPGKRPTELQKLRIQKIRDAGGFAFYTDNLQEVKEFINDISTIQLCRKSE